MSSATTITTTKNSNVLELSWDDSKMTVTRKATGGKLRVNTYGHGHMVVVNHIPLRLECTAEFTPAGVSIKSLHVAYLFGERAQKLEDSLRATLIEGLAARVADLEGAKWEEILAVAAHENDLFAQDHAARQVRSAAFEECRLTEASPLASPAAIENYRVATMAAKATDFATWAHRASTNVRSGTLP